MMRTLFLIGFTFQCFSVFSQTVISWEPEIVVSDGSVYGNVRPRIAINAAGDPVVVYGKGGAGTLHSSALNGSVFSTPIPLLPATMSSYLASWTSADVASKGDTIVVVFKANPMETGHVYTVRSTDGGMTYSDTIRADSHDNGVAWLPSMDMDGNGNPTITYMAHDPNWVHPRYVVTHSTDQGLSYAPEMDIALSVPQEACDCCPAEYVINGNQHALLYRNNDNNVRDIFALYSEDDGMNYNAVENIDQLNWTVFSCPSTGPHGVFNNNKLVTVYASKASGYNRVYISQTTTSPSFAYEDRNMMTPPLNVNGNQNFPRIDGQNDTLVMVWQESEMSNTEIFCSYTVAGNVTELLSSKQIVNSNTVGAQTNPDIVYHKGVAHLVYQDGITGSVIYRKGIFGTAGLSDIDVQQTSVYPNPVSTSEFFIAKSNSSEIEQVKLTDALGKDVAFDIEDQSTRLKISSNQMKEGIYFITLNFSTGEQKIVKMISQ